MFEKDKTIISGGLDYQRGGRVRVCRTDVMMKDDKPPKRKSVRAAITRKNVKKDFHDTLGKDTLCEM